MKSTRSYRLATQLMGATACLFGLAATGNAQKEFVYVSSNNVAEGQNSVLAYEVQADGSLMVHRKSPFFTGGSGIDNDTNGKLGPNDNDTPVIVDAKAKRLFAVNGHSDTVAVMDILADGALRHVPGSPFDAMGIGPVSLALSGGFLLVANRNEDPQRWVELGKENASFTSFHVAGDGALRFISKLEVSDGHKPTQILVSGSMPHMAFSNAFQVDVDFDGDGSVSRLFGPEPHVRGRIRSFGIGTDGTLSCLDSMELPETVEPAPEVPSVPLGLWDHPTKSLLYAGLVTRNQLGVFRFGKDGALSFVTAVPNSGQDICWLKTNRAGTRLYAVNNLPREDRGDAASTLTVFDISGDRAEEPLEIQRIALPLSLGTFVNNRNATQPGSTPFQLGLSTEEDRLFVVCQRIDQTSENDDERGNYLHVLDIDSNGELSIASSLDLGKDGAHSDSRPQGIACIELTSAN